MDLIFFYKYTLRKNMKKVLRMSKTEELNYFNHSSTSFKYLNQIIQFYFNFIFS